MKKVLGVRGLVPPESVKNLHTVVAILEFFEQFFGKFCLNFLPLILRDVFCKYIFDYACLGRKAHCFRKGSKLRKNCIHQKPV